MTEILLLLLLLLLVAVFGVVLGVHLQAAKSKTDCGCGRKRADDRLAQRVRKLELIQWQIQRDKQADASDSVHLQHGNG